MKRIVAYTSFTCGYLSRALVLARTLRAAHPDWELHALVVDRPPVAAAPDPFAVFDAVVFADQLGIERFQSWMFKHDIVEACTAVKGRMLCRLLDEGADAVLYFDPDIAIFHPLDGVVKRMAEGASVLLTPHQLDANDAWSSFADNELGSLRYGVYNLGFLGVANDPNGRAFAAWWDRHLLHACYDEPERSIFTDQKYCDLVPSLFDRVVVLRDPGCNVASWNISRRALSVTPVGDILANGSTLKFYHFTKIFGPGLMMTDKYTGDNDVVIELCRWYRAEVLAHDRALPIPADWAYGAFDNAVAIPKPARLLYRGRPDLIRFFADPFDTAGNSYLTWLRHEQPALLA